MFRALLLSLRQLGDPAILRVLALSLAATLLVFAVVGVLLYFALDWAIGLTGWQSGGGLAAVVAVAAVVIGGWLWWRAVAIGIVGLFAEDIVEAVERRHYPAHADAALRPSLAVQLRQALSSIGRALFFNLLALPVYLLLLATGIGTLLLFLAVNALLLSRELGELVALRRVPWAERHDWLRRTRAKRLTLGLISAGLFAIPVANLLAPVLSAAMAAHLLHEGDRTSA